MKQIIKDITFKTSDKQLNKLLEEAYLKFTEPKIESRVEAIQKIYLKKTKPFKKNWT
ncbi:MAG: hypothetical protein JRJ49_00375 [Deltaproteobacteria bacterium]|nr:hypothetical protein [Deltaproteobacteria bacterium]